ncbi:MAG: carbonic anhydrase [Clostridium sp.]|jgi:carbonic anhydrase|nr:carbonic anhydrase [Clostridium sp.]MBS6502085.1 carbonic anhydrase [Clostridium sp.]MDU1277674.1 carbonic anhydrase [Clostridium sp.]MDU2460363.1 carbonic anhydrase [Clostridium sp.]MDU7086443.1 carbonic anhydrase [Clostridium sp.]MDU7948314.1 carbonic anhydrase [Clostridium sp.]
MSKLDEILEFNKDFVENKDYEQYITSKNPKKKILILSCMDTRLTDLLPKALNLKNGDAKIVKNAGAAIMHPFGSVIRSIIVGIYEFNIDEIFVIGHHGCGMCNLDTDKLLQKAIDRGISKESLDTLCNAGIDIKKWLHGFDSVEESIKDSVNLVKKHPLMPEGISVHGLAIDPETGKLDLIVNGYNK